jgi:ankyrin repeat protein
VNYFLSKGYDIDYEKSGGETALSAAAADGDIRMINFLVSRGAIINRNEHRLGENPLMAAAESGKLEAVKVLLEKGAEPCATNNEGHTAAGMATKYKHAEVAEYLSSRYHCQENVIDSCSDPRVSACVHP